jgi:serine/threonine protein phosphatase 1
MAFYYAMSDIHGYYQPFIDALEIVDLSDSRNCLFLLGDYVAGGKDSCKVLYHVKELCEKYEGQVVALMGNHDKWFLDWLAVPSRDWFRLSDPEFLRTCKSFLSPGQITYVYAEANRRRRRGGEPYEELNKEVSSAIKTAHEGLLGWLRELPLFYEADKQIFVHAGIDEDSMAGWVYMTPEHFFTEKFTLLSEPKSFYKDIVAGHIHPSSGVLWDGASHFYVGGTTEASAVVPVLKYDTESGIYTGYRKAEQLGGEIEWEEYLVVNRNKTSCPNKWIEKETMS